MESETNGNGNSAAAYRAQVQDITEDVTVTNNFVFKMKKRSVFTTVFDAAVLPQTLGSGAVAEWQKQGLIQPGEITKEQGGKVDFLMSLADQIIERSVSPKIVLGEPQNDNELSYKDISEADLEILFIWAVTGGTVSEKLARFSKGATSSPVARASRKKQRHKGQ